MAWATASGSASSAPASSPDPAATSDRSSATTSREARLAHWSSALLALIAGAEVQVGAVRVRHEGEVAEAQRIAAALARAAESLPSFVGASSLEIRARLTGSTDELARL